jgi:hypothetical protein
MKELIQNSEKMMSSKLIAERTGKLHSNVLRDIRTMMDELGDSNYELSDYQVVKREDNGQTSETFLADRLHNYLIDRYKFKSRTVAGLREKVALDTIEQLLNVKLKRQYKVIDYFIDGYDPVNNIAYEIDELGHNTSSAYKHDKKRADRITKKIGCKFVRININY